MRRKRCYKGVSLPTLNIHNEEDYSSCIEKVGKALSVFEGYGDEEWLKEFMDDVEEIMYEDCTDCERNDDAIYCGKDLPILNVRTGEHYDDIFVKIEEYLTNYVPEYDPTDIRNSIGDLLGETECGDDVLTLPDVNHVDSNGNIVPTPMGVSFECSVCPPHEDCIVTITDTDNNVLEIVAVSDEATVVIENSTATVKNTADEIIVQDSILAESSSEILIGDSEVIIQNTEEDIIATELIPATQNRTITIPDSQVTIEFDENGINVGGTVTYPYTETKTIGVNIPESTVILYNSLGEELSQHQVLYGNTINVTAPDAQVSINGGNLINIPSADTLDIPHEIDVSVNGTTIVSGATTDVDLDLVDQNGDPIPFTNTGNEIEVNMSGGGGSFTRPPFNTMQSGDTAIGQDFFTLPQPNHFGHNWRFTGITGGYYDRNTSQYKDVDGNVTTRELAYPNDLRCDWATLNENNEFYLWHLDNTFSSGIMIWVDAVDYCDALTVSTFSGFNMPSFQDMMALYQVNNSVMFSIPELLEATGSVGWWTHTEIPYNSGNVVYNVLNNYRIFEQAKTTLNSYSYPLPVRLTNVSELP